MKKTLGNYIRRTLFAISNCILLFYVLIIDAEYIAMEIKIVIIISAIYFVLYLYANRERLFK